MLQVHPATTISGPALVLVRKYLQTFAHVLRCWLDRVSFPRLIALLLRSVLMPGLLPAWHKPRARVEEALAQFGTPRRADVFAYEQTSEEAAEATRKRELYEQRVALAEKLVSVTARLQQATSSSASSANAGGRDVAQLRTLLAEADSVLKEAEDKQLEPVLSLDDVDAAIEKFIPGELRKHCLTGAFRALVVA